MFSNDIRRTLRGIIREYGLGVCEPPTRVRGFLNDLCGEHKAEINLLIQTLTVCRLAYFQAVKKGQAERLLALKIEAIHYELSITKEAAHWAVETWALALGVLNAPLPRPPVPLPEAQPPPIVESAPPPESPPVPLASCLPETPLVVSEVPTAAALKQSKASLSTIIMSKGRRSPVFIVAGVIAAFVLVIIFISAFSTRSSPAVVQPPASAPLDNPSAALPASTDPASGSEQALAQRIHEISSGLEPGTTLIWPLDGKEHGMKIILPPPSAGGQNFLIGYANIRQGAAVLRGQFEQAFRDAGYPEADVAGCSVFVCSSTGKQLTFSTSADQ